MKFPTTTLLAVLALALAPLAVSTSLAAPKAKPKIPVVSATDSKSLKAQVGKQVLVEGKVISTGKGPKDGMRFLNFSKSETTGFTAALVPAVYPKFPNLDRMVNERVRVTGELIDYKKKTMIKVTRPAQVKILQPKQAKETKKKKAAA